MDRMRERKREGEREGKGGGRRTEGGTKRKGKGRGDAAGRPRAQRLSGLPNRGPALQRHIVETGVGVGQLEQPDRRLCGEVRTTQDARRTRRKSHDARTHNATVPLNRGGAGYGGMGQSPDSIKLRCTVLVLVILL